MDNRKIYIIGSCVALLGSFLINHLLTCVLIGAILAFIPLHRGGMGVDDYYAMKYQECSLDEFENEMFYKAFCKASFVFVATFIYTMCSM